ncbi:pyrroline-5-carboxylate reductase [Prevotella sp. HUN102]|uniref:pyrroline-5-carboxylate reductase n=1 Tax=Prevotella sp. HUN102 TaxID=1392486 RepID=UPI00048B9D7B|nr:pyrroline-5-carboxylate reductase [Prevotella sp. HUN102]
MKISVIGAGSMGGAFAEGLLKGSIFAPEDITVANPHEDKLHRFAEMGASITTSNVAAAMDADIIAIVVKPWLVEEVLKEIKPVFNPEKQMLINMAASVKSAQIIDWMGGDGLSLFQVMPNISIALKESMTLIAPIGASSDQTSTVKEIFDDLGQSLITDETHFAAGTTLASCGIAYALRYIRAASEGGVEIGFKADLSKEIVLQTLKGAVALLQESGEHPEAMIDRVTTPGGLTIRGLNEMEHAGFTSAVIRGLKAAL